MKLSQPINAKGDKLLLPGEPGHLEAWVQHKNHQARIEAEERILGHLEKCPGEMLAVLSKEQRAYLISLIRTLCWQTARGYLNRVIDNVKIIDQHSYTAPYDEIPDPRADGGNLLEIK